MEPEEKAMDIFNKMCNSVDELLPLDVKQCAIIAVIELIIEAHPFGARDYTDWIKNGDSYWHKVKQELEKL